MADDAATDLQAGQMRKSDFLDELQVVVCAEAEAALAGTPHSTSGCPYLAFWFDYYNNQSSEHIEQALHRYVPQARGALSAADYIPLVAARIRQGVERWARTGQITGVPADAPQPAAAQAAGQGAARAVSMIQLKPQDGGRRRSEDPEAVQAMLGSGRALENPVRSRMESAFGRSFSGVRLHTDTMASRLSSEQHARAFTVGRHVAFGAGEYRPGTLVGDALIAHELAHVVQQSGTSTSVAAMSMGGSYDALEEEADRSAVGAVAALWSGVSGAWADIAANAMPRLRSGLRLSRCDEDKEPEPQVQCPTQTVTMGSPACGVKYGAIGKYCYSGAKNWWFKEKVVNGSPNTCDKSPINQTTKPIQAPTGCVSDLIFNFNGPPKDRAPCKDVTNQTVFAGPTKAQVEKCKYQNEQIIEVTLKKGSKPKSGKVITSSAGVSTDCDWTA
ncbi:MAG TPA: DUF4157 domain-containing protein [Acidobacteriota bacterium]|nr:DUF4157 domain-containing protein [Acidobacteriota bacterium]